MIITILFFIFNVITFGYIWFWWNKISGALDFAQDVTGLIDREALMAQNPKVGRAWSFLLLLLSVKDMLKVNQKMAWLPILILVVCNLLLALIVGGSIMLISKLF